MNPYEAEYNSKKAEYDRAKNLIAKASSGTLTPAQQSLLSQYKNKFKQIEADFLAIKQKYDSRTGDAAVANQGNQQLATNTTPMKGTIGDLNAPAGAQMFHHVAPSGKPYDISWDGKQASFINYDKQREYHPSVAAAKAYIDMMNPAGQVDQSLTSQAGADLGVAVDKLTGQLGETKQEGITGQEGIQAKVDTLGNKMVEYEGTITDMINTSFQSAKNSLTAANDLEVEAENIYGQAQIQSQYEDLVRKGLNPAKAKQASLYINLKGRAQLSAKIATIKADFQKTIADLEMKKAELVIQAKKEGIENQKWLIDQAQAIQTQVSNLKNQYNSSVINLEQNFRITPLLNVYSATLENDVKNAIANVQNTYDTSSYAGKSAALLRVLGDSFAYIDSSIQNYMTLPFDQLLIKAIEIIRKNKKAE